MSAVSHVFTTPVRLAAVEPEHKGLAICADGRLALVDEGIGIYCELDSTAMMALAMVLFDRSERSGALRKAAMIEAARILTEDHTNEATAVEKMDAALQEIFPK